MAQKRRDSASTLFTLLLLVVFALCAFFVLALSVRAYRASEAEVAANGTSRTGIAYIVSKVRHYDAADALEVGEFDGYNALFLYEMHEGTRYTTVLYATDGGLYELFSEDVSQFDHSSGTLIVEGAQARFSLADGTLTLQYEADGMRQTLSLTLRSGGGSL